MTDYPLKARRATLQVLFALDVGGMSPEDALEDVRATLLAEDGEPTGPYWASVTDRVRSVIQNQEALDKEIQTLSPSWRLDRMAAVDRNLLRLGIQELIDGQTPPLVVINACVELGKEFGTKSTPGFVNGLLDQTCKNRQIPITR